MRKDRSDYTLQMFVYYQGKLDEQIDVCKEDIKRWAETFSQKEQTEAVSALSRAEEGTEEEKGAPEGERESVEDGSTAKPDDTPSTPNTGTNTTPKARQKKENKAE